MASILKKALGFSRAAKEAKTAADWEAIHTDAQADLIVLTAQLADAEQQRALVALEGGDLDQFHDKLTRLRDKCETIRQTRNEVSRRLEEARAIEATAALEARARDVRENMVPQLEGAALDFYQAGLVFAEAGERLRSLTHEIKTTGDHLKANDRPDLAMDPNHVLAQVSAGLLPPEDESQRPVRMQDETDDAFFLRTINYTTRQQQQSVRDDPVRNAAQNALETAEIFLRPDSPIAAAAGMRRMQASSFKFEGQAYTHVRAVDGLNSPKPVGDRGLNDGFEHYNG